MKLFTTELSLDASAGWSGSTFKASRSPAQEWEGHIDHGEGSSLPSACRRLKVCVLLPCRWEMQYNEAILVPCKYRVLYNRFSHLVRDSKILVHAAMCEVGYEGICGAVVSTCNRIVIYSSGE